jgi:hypothetical protein
MGKLEFTTDVEPWMADHDFTEIFSYAGEPSDDEKAITGELDRILQAVRYGKSGIEETLKEMAKSDAILTKGQKARPGHQSLGSSEGTAVDGVFKSRLQNALDGRLKKWKSMLTVIPPGTLGADVISPSLKAAWDVTTVAQVWGHVERDVFGKRASGKKSRIADLWDRYYLLVWDEPRTDRERRIAQIEAGRLNHFPLTK